MKFNSLPVDAELRVTSKFGKRNLGIENASTFHEGVDLGRDFSKPSTKILAVKSGRIIENRWNNYRGWYVIIRHDEEYSTLYQHLRAKCPLPVGSIVKAGEVIGVMGNSSDKDVLKVATHLHFELRKNGKEIDPLPYLMNVESEVLDLTESELKKMVSVMIKEALDGDGKDVPSNWAKKIWEEATAEGIVDGSRPKAYATREQVAQMLKNTIK